MIQIILLILLILNSPTLEVNGQQNYSGLQSQSCDIRDETGPSPALLYTCNGQNQVCQAFLIFKSQPPYNSVKTISNLTVSSPKELARINNVGESETFPTNKEVIVPVLCSCAGPYYQANTTVILNHNDTYSVVAEDIFQGLTTCNSLLRDNSYGEFDLQPGMELKVPLRCACPTTNQSENGTKYLLTYPINRDDSIPDIGERFNASAKSILDANGFLEEDPTIFISTTLLIPLSTEPSSSQTTVHNSTNTKPVSFPPIFGPSPRTKSKGKLYAVFAITAGCSIIVLGVVLLAALLIYRRRSKGLPRRQTTSKRLSPEDLRVEIASFEKGFQMFGIEEIRKATKNFSPENRIKGSIYYGVFGNSHITLAVKKAKRDVSREVNILKKLNHFNLIKLEGVCKHNDRSYLIFEYMENGSLREWLCRNDNEKDWSWSRRIQIALDIAHGLNYLHCFTEPGYVHKNIKSSNILLNRDMRAKIANFGLAGPAKDQVKTTSRSSQTTTHVVGTRGYVAPEYLANGIVTPKIDVYAFGVVVLELMSGKNAVIGKDIENGRRVLLSRTIVEIMEGDDHNPEAELDSFIDPCLKEDNRSMEFAIRVAKLSIACLKLEPETRPSMGEAISTLAKIQADLQKN
uniref:Lysm-containing receptor kinase 18 n=1 Tax=Parasponia rigida TaxID=3477 RepID=A0A221I0H9_PARRI|nr:lysm-containing receptor kinase 18 [Parasponia rigida]